jgi:hypothetical protein
MDFAYKMMTVLLGPSEEAGDVKVWARAVDYRYPAVFSKARINIIMTRMYKTSI